jgi:hypothetical protein
MTLGKIMLYMKYYYALCYDLFNARLNVRILSVVMPNVDLLTVVASCTFLGFLVKGAAFIFCIAQESQVRCLLSLSQAFYQE